MSSILGSKKIQAVAVAVAVGAIFIAYRAARAVAGAVDAGADGLAGWLVSASVPDVVLPDPAATKGVGDIYSAYGIRSLNGQWDNGSTFSIDYKKAKILFGVENPTYEQILSARALRVGKFN